MSNNAVGRPAEVAENAILVVNSGLAKTKLQSDSERRAIVNHIIDAGGSSTIAKLNAHFGYNVRAKIMALVDLGWISVKDRPVLSRKK